MHVNISYMESVVSDLSELIEAYPFYDILQNPPNPYQDLKVYMANLFKDIKINESRPFYEFYQDIKTTFKKLSDSVFEIIGDEIPINGEIIKFSEYHICLPFKFYLDYKKKEAPKMYIKEYEECSKYFSEEARNFIKESLNEPLEKINGEDPFDFIHNFGNEFYKFKNSNSIFL
jgi:hypothetical protein